MSRITPRQRSPQPTATANHPYPTASTTSRPPSFHSHTFDPTPPFTNTSINPYGKPGYFLTPQSSLSHLHLPPGMWMWRGTGAHYVGLLVLLVCCMAVFSLVTNMRHPLDVVTVDATGSSLGAAKQAWGVDTDFDVHAALRPLIAVEASTTKLSKLNVPTFYQRSSASMLAALSSNPRLLSHILHTDHPAAVAREEEKGLVILLHGCSHDGSDWFTLPEERRIVRLLLASGYTALAFTSADRDSGCWDNRWSADNVDVQRVIAALQAFIAAHYSDGSHPPLFIMGASSGGTFASILARTVPTTAQCIIVSPGSDTALLTPTSHPPARPYSEWSSGVLSSADGGLYSVPPTAWLFMTRDVHWASEAKITSLHTQMASKASQLGYRIAHSKQPTLLFPTKQHPLTKSYMSDRLDEWSADSQLGALFYRLAHREGFVDRYDYLIDNPRSSGMAAYMVDAMARELSSASDSDSGGSGSDVVSGVVSGSVAAVGEELAVLWGEHEMTSDHMLELVQWMERQRTRAA